MSDLKTKIKVETKDKHVYLFVSQLTKEQIGNTLNSIYKDTNAHHIGFMFESGNDCYLPLYLLNESIITLSTYDK